MISELTTTTLVEWSRWQFAMTAIYHYMFVPLTLGLSFLLAIMETMWVRTGKAEWLNATKFWMKLFAINFAIGIATGLILEFQFGSNWSNYSWFVGHRRFVRFLSRSHFLRRHVLRLEQGKPSFSSGFHLDGIHRFQHFRFVDPGSECVDAKPGRHGIQPDDSPQRNVGFLGGTTLTDSHE